ncbi:MAG: hypothetical protein U0V87_14200 [Acidobacteriota bacterium]
MGEQRSVRLGFAEAQQKLGLTPGDVLSLVESGRLSAVRAPFGLRFEADDVNRVAEELLASKRKRGEPGLDH